MRLGKFRLENYVGIYNGLGLDKIEIDFRKAKNRIIRIVGENGSGKSVIINSLTMIPDHNSSFINGRIAKKYIEYIVNDSLEYHITMTHNVTTKGEREPAKVSLIKVVDGDETELNVNGNVGSYKDIISSEFGFDINFLALMTLSATKRGIGDMTPADRKKYVSLIISELVDYNNVNKVLSKRSTIYKSMINVLVSKIKNLGDLDYLQNNIKSIDNRILAFENEKNVIISKMSQAEAVMNMHDPDLKIQTRYNTLNEELINKHKLLETNQVIYSDFINKHHISNTQEFYTNVKSEIDRLNISNQILNTKISTLISDRDNDMNNINENTTKLMAIQCDFNIPELKAEIESLNKSVSDTIDELKSYSQLNMNNCYDIEYYVSCIDIIDTINEQISVFKSKYDFEIVSSVLSWEFDLDLDNKIEDCNKDIMAIESLIVEANTIIETYNHLELRPTDCKIDSCPFISESMRAKEVIHKYDLNKLEQQKIELYEKKELLLNRKTMQDSLMMCNNDINVYTRSVLNYNKFLTKMGLQFNESYIKDILCNSWKDYTVIKQTIQDKIEVCNITYRMNGMTDKLKQLQVEWDKYESKKDIIDLLSNTIAQQNEHLNELLVEIEKSNSEIAENNTKIMTYTKVLTETEQVLVIYKQIQDLENDINSINSNLASIQNSMKIINENIVTINNLKVRLESIQETLKPLYDDKSTMLHSLKLSSEYNSELEEYQAKYNKIETIKKYSSPTKEGIQLVFMELYMGTTVSIANELLAMMFGGQYIFGKFVINEREFRIPCIGEGIINDDISSMSGAQICMTSMIISFSLAHQASSKYNIIKLDEVDAMLDSNNRASFIPMIYAQMDMLHMDQCILISHNNESSVETDLVLLKMNGIDQPMGNVIFQY